MVKQTSVEKINKGNAGCIDSSTYEFIINLSNLEEGNHDGDETSSES
jgi:hypothetical protein